MVDGVTITPTFTNIFEHASLSSRVQISPPAASPILISRAILTRRNEKMNGYERRHLLPFLIPAHTHWHTHTARGGWRAGGHSMTKPRHRKVLSKRIWQCKARAKLPTGGGGGMEKGEGKASAERRKSKTGVNDLSRTSGWCGKNGERDHSTWAGCRLEGEAGSGGGEHTNTKRRRRAP